MSAPGFDRDGGSTVTISGNLINSGTLNIHDDTATATVVTASALTTVAAPSTLSAMSSADGTGNGGADPDLGRGTLDAELDHHPVGPSLLQFASGGISSIAAGGKLVVGGCAGVCRRQRRNEERQRADRA